jgi:hypothetical protein
MKQLQCVSDLSLGARRYGHSWAAVKKTVRLRIDWLTQKPAWVSAFKMDAARNQHGFVSAIVWNTH